MVHSPPALPSKIVSQSVAVAWDVRAKDPVMFTAYLSRKHVSRSAFRFQEFPRSTQAAAFLALKDGPIDPNPVHMDAGTARI